MAGEALKQGTLFDPHLVTDLMTKVKGKSSLAALSQQIPLAFNGAKEFVFSMEKDVEIVGESSKKGAGGIGLDPVTIRPVKFVYQARVTDEFLRASEEEQINILEAFNDGFAKRIAAGFDIAAMHGLNPADRKESTVVGDNCFDKQLAEPINYSEETPDINIEKAIAKVEEADGDVNGIVISPAVAADLAAMRMQNGDRVYPEFAFGGHPANLGAQKLEVNKTVAVASTESESRNDCAIVGDFANAFKWGYAAEIPLEVIQYGDPDQSGTDLKASNQVCLRAEVYIGWGILDKNAFVRVANVGE